MKGMKGGDGGVGRGRVIASLCYVPPSHSEEFKRRWMGGWWGEESLNRVKTSGKNAADDRRWYSERLWLGGEAFRQGGGSRMNARMRSANCVVEIVIMKMMAASCQRFPSATTVCSSVDGEAWAEDIC